MGAVISTLIGVVVTVVAFFALFFGINRILDLARTQWSLFVGFLGFGLGLLVGGFLNGNGVGGGWLTIILGGLVGAALGALFGLAFSGGIAVIAPHTVTLAIGASMVGWASILGGFLGLSFGGVLSLSGKRRSVDELSGLRSVLLGAVGGAVLAVVISATQFLGVSLTELPLFTAFMSTVGAALGGGLVGVAKSTSPVADEFSVERSKIAAFADLVGCHTGLTVVSHGVEKFLFRVHGQETGRSDFCSQRGLTQFS